jgi:hypothetical protein
MIGSETFSVRGSRLESSISSASSRTAAASLAQCGHALTARHARPRGDTGCLNEMSFLPLATSQRYVDLQ